MRLADARKGLLELIESDDQRTKMGRFADVYDLVERALTAGASRSAVIEKLAEAGLNLTPATFGSYLARSRANKPVHRPEADAKAPVPAAAAAPTAPLFNAAVASSPPRQKSITEIRNTEHDLDAMRRRWRKLQREEGKQAAGTPPPPPAPADE